MALTLLSLSVHQYARVWLPDAAEVWKSAELIKDFTPGDLTLDLQLEDGTVRLSKCDKDTEMVLGCVVYLTVV